MEDHNWMKAIKRWRNLSEAEKHEIRWKMIPRSVAARMAFEGEPVDLQALETAHACQPMPPVIPTHQAEPDPCQGGAESLVPRTAKA